MLVAPCDKGLTLVAGQPPLDDERDWRDPAVLESVATELVAPPCGVLDKATMVGELRARVRRMDGFFGTRPDRAGRWSATPATRRDIVVGQGICDALRQGELCCPVG